MLIHMSKSKRVCYSQVRVLEPSDVDRTVVHVCPKPPVDISFVLNDRGYHIVLDVGVHSPDLLGMNKVIGLNLEH